MTTAPSSRRPTVCRVCNSLLLNATRGVGLEVETAWPRLRPRCSCVLIRLWATPRTAGQDRGGRAASRRGAARWSRLENTTSRSGNCFEVRRRPPARWRPGDSSVRIDYRGQNVSVSSPSLALHDRMKWTMSRPARSSASPHLRDAGVEASTQVCSPVDDAAA